MGGQGGVDSVFFTPRQDGFEVPGESGFSASQGDQYIIPMQEPEMEQLAQERNVEDGGQGRNGPAATHHRAAFLVVMTLKMIFFHERLVKINIRLAKTNDAKERVRASSSPLPK